MGIRGYQKFNMVVASESQYNWASADYSLIALKSDTTLPTGLSTSTYAGITRNNQSSITDATFTESFIIPRVFDVLSIIDGTIEGTLKMSAIINGSHGASTWIKITKAEVTINAIDTDGNTREIAATQEVWSGEVLAGYGSESVSKQIMYWIDIEDADVYANERVVLDYTFTYSTYDSLSQDELYARMYCTPDTDETTITLPFVM